MNNQHRMALGIEYDGTLFKGWQRQKEVRSIQETVEEALSKVASQPIQTIAAGRTDAKVHATYQVIHFDTDAIRSERAWVFGTNTHLPSSVRVLFAKTVERDFDARRSATARRYRYIVHNHPIRPALSRHHVGWYYRKLDVQRMREGAAYWIGEHDFSSFRASECQSKTPFRHVFEITIERFQDKVIIEIEANAFLHHMVRNMVGVLWKIGSGQVKSEFANFVLQAKSRKMAGVTASPSGLYLVAVRYPEEFGIPIP